MKSQKIYNIIAKIPYNIYNYTIYGKIYILFLRKFTTNPSINFQRQTTV